MEAGPELCDPVVGVDEVAETAGMGEVTTPKERLFAQMSRVNISTWSSFENEDIYMFPVGFEKGTHAPGVEQNINGHIQI